MTFNDITPWTALAGGGVIMGAFAGAALFWTIKADEATQFIDAFKTAKSMRLDFLQGSEKPWSISVNGSREVTDAFTRCMARLGGKENGEEVSKGASKETQSYSQPSSEPDASAPRPVPIKKPQGESI